MKTVSDELFQLIQSLSKQEKRYFKLYSRRHGGSRPSQYVRLFDAISRQSVYDEAKIRQVFAGEAFLNQLHVTKNYLYKLILSTLRMYHENNTEDPFPALMRNSQLLFEKGLYKQSEKMLQKARQTAADNERFLQLLEVYRWEHHIIHSKNDHKKLEEYVYVGFQKEINILEIYRNYLQFQLLHDQVFIPYWKKGSIRHETEKAALSQLFERKLYQHIDNARSFNARLFYHNARFTYFFLTGELEKCYEHIRQQVQMFEQLPKIQRKGRINKRYASTIINMYIVQRHLKLHQEGLASLQKLREIPGNSIAQKARLVTRSYNLELDLYVSTGQFSRAAQNMHAFEDAFDKYEEYIENQHRLGIFFNLAYVYFGAGHYEQALEWINRLLNDPELKIREDIHCFGRILNLFIHYELGNDKLLEYIVQSTYRYLSKRKRLFKVESIILKFLKKYPDWVSRSELLDGFVELHEDLLKLRQDEYERRAFEYFDFTSWLESKLQDTDFESVVKQHKIGQLQD